MKRLLKFETFVPKKIANRAAEARSKGIFAVSDNNTYLMSDGQLYSCTLNYYGSRFGPYDWVLNLITTAEAYVTMHTNLRCSVKLAKDLSSVSVDYARPNTARIWLQAAADEQRMATNLATEMIFDLDTQGLGPFTQTQTAAQLYAWVDQLQPMVLAELLKLRPTV